MTFDDFYALAKAFTDKSKGVYGITLAGSEQFSMLLAPENPGTWEKDASGRWVPHILAKSFVTALQQVRRLYNDGILDPDGFMIKDKVGLDKFAQGKAGILIFNGGPSHLKQVYDRWINSPGNPPR